MTELSVIIVSTNESVPLRACLASIFQNPPAFPFEVLVVDNASRDGSAGIVRAEFPAARLVEKTENRGFGAANNLGAKSARGRRLLFLNPDTIVHPGALDGIRSFMERRPRVGIAGCRTLNRDGSLQHTARSFPSPARVFANVSGLSRRFGWLRRAAREPERPDYVQGSFLAIDRELFLRIGGFDERIFLYNEEVDLCLRARQAGREVAFDPGAVITHLNDSGSYDARRTGWLIASSLLLYAKHRGAFAAGSLRWVIRLALAVRFLASGALLPGDALDWQGLRRLARLAAAPGGAPR